MGTLTKFGFRVFWLRSKSPAPPDEGRSRSVLIRPHAGFLAADRQSGRTAHKLDKLRKRGFSSTPLPIHTGEWTAPTLPPQRGNDVRVGRLLLVRIPRTIGIRQRAMTALMEPDQRQRLAHVWGRLP